MLLMLINIKSKCETFVRFLENNYWVNSKDSHDWFQWYSRYWLGRRSLDNKRQKK